MDGHSDPLMTSGMAAKQTSSPDLSEPAPTSVKQPSRPAGPLQGPSSLQGSSLLGRSPWTAVRHHAVKMFPERCLCTRRVFWRGEIPWRSPGPTYLPHAASPSRVISLLTSVVNTPKPPLHGVHGPATALHVLASASPLMLKARGFSQPPTPQLCPREFSAAIKASPVIHRGFDADAEADIAD